MNKLSLFILLLLDGALVFAQPLDSEGERSRIRDARVREEAQYQVEEAACYARFAVTDCLNKVRARRREVLDDLRRQERVLNDLERKRRALEQIDQINQKSSARQIEEETSVRPAAGDAR